MSGHYHCRHVPETKLGEKFAFAVYAAAAAVMKDAPNYRGLLRKTKPIVEKHRWM
jgi:hypothetical protein